MTDHLDRNFAASASTSRNANGRYERCFKRTALTAIEENNYDVLKAKIQEFKGDVKNIINSTDPCLENDSLLMIALKTRNELTTQETRQSNENIISLLLNHGASTCIENDVGETPFQFVNTHVQTNPQYWNSINNLFNPHQSPLTVERINKTDILDLSEGSMGEHEATLETENLKFAAAGGKTGFHGLVFQLKLLMITLYRGIKLVPSLLLATEKERAEKIDDVVLRYQKPGESKWNWYFAQAKHKLDVTKSLITLWELFYKTNGDYSLAKYFVSSVKIKGNPHFRNDDIDRVVICSNTSLKDDAKNYFTLSEPDTFLHFDNAKTYELNLEILKEIEGKFERQQITKISELNLSKPTQTEKKKNGEENRLIAKLLKTIQNGLKEIEEETKKKEEENDQDTLSTIAFLKRIHKETQVHLEEIKNDAEKKNAENYKGKRLLHKLHKEENYEEKHLINKFLEGIQKEIKVEVKKIQDDIKKIISIKGNILVAETMEEVEKEIRKDGIIGKISDELLTTINQKQLLLQNLKKSLEKEMDGIIEEYTEIQKALNITELKDLKYFLTKIRFICNCPDDSEIDKVISGELGEQFGLLNADLLSHSFEHDMVNWFKECHNGKGTYLCMADGDRMLNLIKNRVISLSATGFSLAHLNRVQRLGVAYKELPQEIKIFMSNNACNVLFILTGSTILSSIKTIQVINEYGNISGKRDNFLFIKSDELVSENTQVLIKVAFNSTKCYKFIVVEFEKTFQEETKPFFLEIISTIAQHTAKKIFFIFNNHDQTVSSIKLLLKRKYVEFNDININFKDFDVPSQELILKSKVVFQIHHLCMNELINRESACDVIDPQLLIKLLKHETVTIGESNLSRVPNYCIERKLCRERTERRKDKDRSDVLVDLRIVNSAVIFVTGIDKKTFEHFLDKRLGLIFKHEGDDFYYKEDNFTFDDKIDSHSLNIVECNLPSWPFSSLPPQPVFIARHVGDSVKLAKSRDKNDFQLSSIMFNFKIDAYKYTIIVCPEKSFNKELFFWHLSRNILKNNIENLYWIYQQNDQLHLKDSIIPDVLVDLRTLKSALIFISGIDRERFKPFLNKKRGLIYRELVEICKEKEKFLSDSEIQHVIEEEEDRYNNMVLPRNREDGCVILHYYDPKETFLIEEDFKPLNVLDIEDVSSMPFEHFKKKFLIDYNYTIILTPQCELLEDLYANLDRSEIENLYWIDHCNNKLVLKESENNLSEDYLANLENGKQIYIVTNNPGMGKSLLLTSLAPKIQQRYRHSWVVRVNLNNYVYSELNENNPSNKPTLGEISFSDNETDMAIDFITDMLFSNEQHICKYFFKLYLRNSSGLLNVSIKIVLLIDGFDEISPEFKEKVLALLKALQNSNFALMFITTRLHEKISLKSISSSNTTFLNLLPPSSDQKVQFLNKLWQQKMQCFELRHSEEAYKKIIHYLNEFVSANNNFDSELISRMRCFRQSFEDPWSDNEIAISLRLLRDVVQELDFTNLAKSAINHWEKLINIDAEFTDIPLNLMMYGEIMFEENLNLIDINDLPRMCKRFITIKFDHYRDKVGLRTGVGNEARLRDETYLKDLHENISFKKEFGDKSSFVIEGDDKVHLVRVGLLEYDSNGNLGFIHQIYSEHFLAQYLLKHVRSIQVQEIIFKNVLYNEKYQTVRLFLNDLLIDQPYECIYFKLPLTKHFLHYIMSKICKENVFALLVFFSTLYQPQNPLEQEASNTVLGKSDVYLILFKFLQYGEDLFRFMLEHNRIQEYHSFNIREPALHFWANYSDYTNNKFVLDRIYEHEIEKISENITNLSCDLTDLIWNDVISVTNEAGDTVLHILSRNSQFAVIKEFLSWVKLKVIPSMIKFSKNGNLEACTNKMINLLLLKLNLSNQNFLNVIKELDDNVSDLIQFIKDNVGLQPLTRLSENIDSYGNTYLNMKNNNN